MIFLRRLVKLLVLLIHSGCWWGVAPSPTDEGALRAGHGEHGEPGHQEPHKDSYSTFASEFLESRYLSDDGEGSFLGYCLQLVFKLHINHTRQ